MENKNGYIIDFLIYLLTNWQISLPAAVTTAIVVAGYYHMRNVYSYWDRLGIKGPRPLPFFGNTHNLMQRVTKDIIREWSDKYGKVFGIYLGTEPKLIVADAETVVQLCVKDFECCPNHINDNSFMGDYFRNFVFNMVGERWKRTRALLSPTFTSSKIRRMFKMLIPCTDDLVAAANEQLDASKGIVNVKDLFNLYTMDGITTCCYGIKLDRSNNPEAKGSREDFVKAGDIFVTSYMQLLMFFLLPLRLYKLFSIPYLTDACVTPLGSRLRQIINSRRETSVKHDDYLQLLLDAKPTNKLDLDDLDAKENHHAGLTSNSLQADHEQMLGSLGEGKSKAELTEKEVLSSATVFMAVGLETTSSLLCVSLIALAHHAEIQEILYDELKAIHKGERFEYDDITSCQYLDAVISECLRCMNTFPTTDRQLLCDYRLEKYNFNLPKNLMITIALTAIMNDPDYWPEPEKFKPDRFLPENRDKIVPGSYCPFGIGPRHCLGMRFSLTEAKLALARLTLEFQFKPVEGSSFPPKTRPGLSALVINRPIVHFSRRD